MVAFSVYKSSKYLFDCVGVTNVAQSKPYPIANLDALEALRLNAVDVVKRMDCAEIDKLIACCQKPPQTVVIPATSGDIAPFQEFAKYLKARQRAGVVLLADGRLLILAPLENNDARLRCVVVHAKTSAETSTTLPSHATTVRANKAASGQHSLAQPRPVTALPPSVPEKKGKKRRRVRTRPYNLARRQEGEVADATYQGSSAEPHQHSGAQPAFAQNKELTMLYNLPRLERATQIAQLRQEYEAFHELHYKVLQDWSKSDPDEAIEG